MIRRCASCLAFAAGCLGLAVHQTRADAIYSVSDLGPASPSAAYLNGTSPIDPSGNYLRPNASQQAAFQAGSFDVYAHPASGWSAASQQNPDLTNVQGTLFNLNTRSLSMVTSNNVGGYAGTASLIWAGGLPSTRPLHSPPIRIPLVLATTRRTPRPSRVTKAMVF